MRTFLTSLTAVSVLAVSGWSQDYEIKKVWEYLPTQPTAEYPWLKASSGSNWEHNTTNTMDFTSDLVRYDETRLMLFLAENGVDEANATAEDAAIAAEFPDRSFLWINPVDGSFMGVALTLPLTPTEDSEYYTQKVTGTHPDGPTSDRSWALIEQWPHFAVDGDGYLYVSDKHKVLRYLPDGNDGFTGPEIVYTYPEADPPIWSVNPANLHYRAWTIQSITVTGSGNNKLMTTAARFWIDGGGIVIYTSTDGGATFTAQQHRGQEQRGGIGTGGTGSGIVTNPDAGEEYMFGTGFPGSDDRLYRFYRTLGSTDNFEQDVPELWDPQPDPAEGVANVDKYGRTHMIDVAVYGELPYLAVLSLPQWQSRNNPDTEEATAWVALHSISLDPNDDVIEGDFLSSYRINFREKDEPQGVAGDEDNWDAAYYASIRMFQPEGFPAGTAEILWSGGTFGFGRLVVGDVDIPTAVNEWSLF